MRKHTRKSSPSAPAGMTEAGRLPGAAALFRKPGREDLIACLREIAGRTGARAVSRPTFHRLTGISDRHYLRCFGSYNRFVRAAGLTPYTGNRRVSDEALLSRLHAAWKRAKGPVPRDQVQRWSGHPVRAYTRRLGRWPDVLTALRQWIERNDSGFAHLPALRHMEERAWGRRPERRAGRRYGPMLNHPAFRHAPVNEQGVVLLFGMVAEALGFIIEGAGAGFPDCDAKRRSGDGWEAVRIEFEMASRNFHAHGHDAAGCDLIVCWEHDWPECPLEVLELKSAIEGMRNRAPCSAPAAPA